MNPFRKFLTSEDLFQEACINYLKLQHRDWLVAHVPNEGKKSAYERYKTSIDGTLKGFSDILILEHEANYFGMAIELKCKDNKCTDDQADFLIRMSERGFATAVVYDDVNKFIECINDWISGKFEPYTVALYKKEVERIGLDKVVEKLTPKSSPHLKGIKRGGKVKNGELFCKEVLKRTN